MANSVHDRGGKNINDTNVNEIGRRARISTMLSSWPFVRKKPFRILVADDTVDDSPPKHDATNRVSPEFPESLRHSRRNQSTMGVSKSDYYLFEQWIRLDTGQFKKKKRLNCRCIFCDNTQSNYNQNVEDPIYRSDFLHIRPIFWNNQMLYLLSRWAGTQDIFYRISNELVESWKHDRSEYGRVAVDRGFCVNFFHPNPALADRFFNYVFRLWQLTGRHPNIMALWHGTMKLCNSNEPRCNLPDCSSCNIMKDGFNISSPSPREYSWQRYGQGIYFAVNSSKAHTYVNKRHWDPHPDPNGNFALVLSFVALGKVYQTNRNDLSNLNLTSAPNGCDSLHGMVKSDRSSSKDLRFEEYVVYDSAAVIPIALVEYKVKK